MEVAGFDLVGSFRLPTAAHVIGGHGEYFRLSPKNLKYQVVSRSFVDGVRGIVSGASLRKYGATWDDRRRQFFPKVLSPFADTLPPS